MNHGLGGLGVVASVFAMVIVAGCAASPAVTESPATPPPAYLTEAAGCALVVSGSVGDGFADAKAAKFYHDVNASVGKYLHEGLADAGYRVVPVAISVEDADARRAESLIVRAMATHRCSRILQLSLAVNEDAQGRFFRFDVTMLRAQPSGLRSPGASGTKAVTVGEYAKSYRFARTKEVFDTFYTGTFAGEVANDLVDSGKIDVLLPPPATRP